MRPARGPAGASAREALGRYGEAMAARFLRRSGMRLLDRNWRCRFGEIDIVALDGDSLVVCEVKTRTTSAIQHPLAAITDRKAERLRLLAEMWLTERWPEVAASLRAAARAEDDGVAVRLPSGIRVDVVGVIGGLDCPVLIEHVRGAL